MIAHLMFLVGPRQPPSFIINLCRNNRLQRGSASSVSGDRPSIELAQLYYIVEIVTYLQTKIVSIEAKLTALYFSALLGASASEIEVCRVGLWGCDPLRGAWVVHTGATPMLILLIFTPMSRRLLAIVSVTVGVALLLFGIRSAHSEGSLTWAAHLFTIWCVGILGAGTLFGISATRRYRTVASLPPPPSLPPNKELSPRPLSINDRLKYLCTGAAVGGLFGQIELYRTGTESLSSDWLSSLIIATIWLILIVGGTAAPTIIILSHTYMEEKLTIICSCFLGIIMLANSIIYAHLESLLGYMCLWFAGIVAALASLILQNRQRRALTVT